MKLREYIKLLNKIAATGKNSELEVVYSCDSEGNSYEQVFYAPAVMPIDEVDFRNRGDIDPTATHVICIN